MQRLVFTAAVDDDTAAAIRATGRTSFDLSTIEDNDGQSITDYLATTLEPAGMTPEEIVRFVLDFRDCDEDIAVNGYDDANIKRCAAALARAMKQTNPTSVEDTIP